MPGIVTDPAKIVTDEFVKKQLAEQGIDWRFVEFWHDYAPRSKGKEYSPHTKFYRDLKSGKHIGVLSGLPMVKPDGQKIEVGWVYDKGEYYSKPNLFSANVEGKQVKLTCLSDQPTGAKKGNKATYKPQLFIDGVEIINGSKPILLPVDPVNSSYKENTLEWAYGTISKRRIRIIEGHYWDKFFILSHPHGRVSVKNNIDGNLKLRLGVATDAAGLPLKVSVIGDEETIEASEFDNAVFPVEIGASQTFYPGFEWVRDGGNPIFGEAPRRGGETVILEEDDTHYHLYINDPDTDYDVKHTTANSVDGAFGGEEKALDDPGGHGGMSILMNPTNHRPIKLSESDLGISGDATQKYWMFYGDANGDISIATNISLSGEWTKEAGLSPCLVRDPGQWDAERLGWDGIVVFEDSGTFYMLYEGWDAEPVYTRVRGGLATSADLVNWNRSGSNPVFSGTAGEWDFENVRTQDVWKTGSTFILVYTGFNWTDHTDEALGIATSTDLINWTKDPGNPKFEFDGATWEATSVSDFCLFRGDHDYIFYESGNVGVGRAWRDDILAEVTVDGWAGHNETLSWANLIIAAGSNSSDDLVNAWLYYIYSHLSPNWNYLMRGIYLFDLFGLPPCIVTNAVFSSYGSDKMDNLGINPDVNIYSSAPVSTTQLENGDFNSLGSTPYSTAIIYANQNTGDPGVSNDFTFNAAGIAAVQAAADANGIVKLGTRNANYDVSTNPPAHSDQLNSGYRGWTVEKGGGHRPKLVVTYTELPSLSGRSAGMGAKMIAGKLI